jgi:hypothetical protein
MLEDLSSVSMLTAVEIIGPLILAAALIFAILRTRRRSAMDRARTETATRQLREKGEDQR